MVSIPFKELIMMRSYKRKTEKQGKTSDEVMRTWAYMIVYMGPIKWAYKPTFLKCLFM